MSQGQPDALPFAKPSITDRERAAVLEVLDSGWLTTGPRVKAFEAAFAEFTGSRHAVALNSATAALHLALEAIGVRDGDEVIVPTWTFAACAEVVTYLRGRIILVDVDRETLNLTPEIVLRAVTPRTRAVIAVHFAGRPMDIAALKAALDPLGIPIVEDAAHAFPSRIGGPVGRLAGTIGRAGAFSFYATKTITTGEGGMLVTDDDDLADRARQMSLHGISRDAWKRYATGGSWYYQIEEAGFKDNMTDIAAALGLVQLSRADELLESRRMLVAAYRQAFGRSAIGHLVELPSDAPDGSHAWHLFVARLRLDRIGEDRATVIEGLTALGIGTSVHFIPLHQHPYHRRTGGWLSADFPVAEQEFPRVLSLPLWPGMTDADVERVVGAIGAVLHPLDGSAAGA